MRKFRRAAVSAACLAALALPFAACGSDEAPAPGPADAGFAGYWRRTEPPRDAWLLIEPAGDGYTVTAETVDLLVWSMSPSPSPRTAVATVEDGTLVVPASGSYTDTTLTCTLTDSGHLRATTTVTVQGVSGEDVKTEVAVDFTRATAAGHDRFLASAARLRAQDDADRRDQEQLATLADAVLEWAQEHGGEAPPVDEVSREGAVGRMMAADLLTWPASLDGTPWSPGRGVGQYVYVPAAQRFRITYRQAVGHSIAQTVSW